MNIIICLYKEKITIVHLLTLTIRPVKPRLLIAEAGLGHQFEAKFPKPVFLDVS